MALEATASYDIRGKDIEQQKKTPAGEETLPRTPTHYSQKTFAKEKSRGRQVGLNMKGYAISKRDRHGTLSNTAESAILRSPSP